MNLDGVSQKLIESLDVANAGRGYLNASSNLGVEQENSDTLGVIRSLLHSRAALSSKAFIGLASTDSSIYSVVPGP